MKGRNLEFQIQKLELAHTQDVGVFDYNFVGWEMELLLKYGFEILKIKKQKKCAL
jgi:hypothetical protein